MLLSHVTHYFRAVGLQLCRESPGEQRIPLGWDMEVGEACGYLDQVGNFLRDAEAKELAAIPTPTSVYLFGCEPFFQPDNVEEVLACAQRNQMASEIWTTGAWVENQVGVRKMLARLAGKLYALSICTSRELLDRVGIDRIELLIAEARGIHLGVSIRCAIGPLSPFPRELLALETLNADAGFLHVIPLSSLTEGTRSPDRQPGYLLDEPPLRRRCAGLLDFLIAPGGDVYPCARGIGVPALRLGSLNNESVLDIIRRTLANSALRKLRAEGPYYLYKAVKGSKARNLLYPGYVDCCHFHHHALSDPELAQIVSRTEEKLDSQGGDSVEPRE
jgi:hypothetical protein